MKRKKLLPKPEPPPDGHMIWHGEIVTVSQFERETKAFYDSARPFQPDWRDDPTYHMKVNKRRKQDVV